MTDTGKIDIEVPRDRQGSFDPQLIAKYQRRFPGFDDKIVSMYARGMSTREIAAVVPPAAAKDYGQVGTVFPLLEPDMLRVIELKLKTLQANGQLDAMNLRLRTRTEARVRRPDPVAGIELATRARTWLFDPSIVIDHDIRDHKVNLISAAGTRVNPLDYVVVTTPLVFIDGDDEAQIAWALKRFDTKARLIMVKGAPLEAMTRHQRRFYFDQAGRLTAKFGITHVPAVVEQAGRAMRITETPVKGKPS